MQQQRSEWPPKWPPASTSRELSPVQKSASELL